MTASTASHASPPGLIDVPRGLAGVAVTDTALSDVRGTEGFYHYRQYDATELARFASLEDVWALLVDGDLPNDDARAAFAGELVPLRSAPARLHPVLGALAGLAGAVDPMSLLRSALSGAGSALGLAPLWDGDGRSRRHDVLAVAAVVPTLVAALHRLRSDRDPVTPRDDLRHTANYLWMLTGTEPSAAHVRALERYLVTTVDHGFNASTFTARVVASTGADAAACSIAGIGALSGPLHGGAPSRALDMLEQIGSPERAEPWLRGELKGGRRLMGFGHAVYRGPDPRSTLLRETVTELAAGDVPAEHRDLAALAVQVERQALDLLAELRPNRSMGTNVEFYAGVLMELVGLPRELFSATFAVARSVGWSAHVLEQTTDRKIVRPSARYVGPPPPVPVPRGNAG